MDGYLSKPINGRALEDALKNLSSYSRKAAPQKPVEKALEKPIEKPALQTPPPAPVSPPISASSPAPPANVPPPEPKKILLFDEAAALARFGGDRPILKELIAVYLQDSEAYLDQVRSAYASKDGKALGKAAHNLKGAIGYFCAPGLHAEANEIEIAAAGGGVREADARVAGFLDRVAEFNRALAVYIRAAAA